MPLLRLGRGMARDESTKPSGTEVGVVKLESAETTSMR